MLTYLNTYNLNILISDFISRLITAEEDQVEKDILPIFYDNSELLLDSEISSIINRLYLGLPLNLYFLEKPDRYEIIKGNDATIALCCFFKNEWRYPESGLIEELRGKLFKECSLPMKRRFGEVKCIALPLMGANDGKEKLFVESV